MGKLTRRLWLAGMLCLVPATGSVLAGPAPVRAPAPTMQAPDEDPEIQALMMQLSMLGEMASKSNDPAQIAHCSLQQADVLTRISNRSRPEERTTWLRQVIDSLQMAAASSPPGDVVAHQRLVRLEAQISQGLPGSALAAYVTYQEIQVDHRAGLGDPAGDAGKVQRHWRDRLAQFVQSYPQSEEAPQAWMELAAVYEALGQPQDAHQCYAQLAREFAQHPLGIKAAGALLRMDLPGTSFALALPRLEDLSDPFDIDQLRGKVVVVCFWASGDPQCAANFGKLTQLLDQHPGVELLCVNLDTTPEEGLDALHGMHVPGTHVYQRGGLGGRVALRYGISALPGLVIVDRAGKVASLDVSLTNLDKEIASQLDAATAR